MAQNIRARARLQDPRLTTVTTLVLIGALLADSLLSDLSSVVNQVLPENFRVILFSVIVCIAAICGGHAVLYCSREITRHAGSRNSVFMPISKIMPFIQYSVIGLLVIVNLQIFFSSQYNTVFVVAMLASSWSIGVAFMAIMSLKFIQWYRVKRNNLVLLYLVSSILFCATLGATIVPQSFITLETSMVVSANTTEVKPFQANPEDLSMIFAIVSIANWIVVPLVFIIWAATAIMLKDYSRKLGRTRYSAIISAPLASVIIGVVFWLIFLPTLTSIFDNKVIPYTMAAFGGILAEGFLLGSAFIIIARKLKEKTPNSTIIKYLRTSAIGVALIFVSFFANPSAGSYLPFGIIAASFFAFGAYLFFSGIYYSAISIASDTGLRKMIRQSLIDRSKLLDNIGDANMYQELNSQTLEIVQKHREGLADEAGVESSISDLEIKNYVEEIVTEMIKEKEEKEHPNQL